MSSWMDLNFQDCSSLMMSELNFLHDHIMTVMVSVMILISYMVYLLAKSSYFYKFFSEGTLIETIWSVIPALLLLMLLFPSMKILYVAEDIKTPSMSVKVVAHQWYWTYVTPFYKNVNISVNGGAWMDVNHEFDSNMEENHILRLLSCSNEIFIPTGTMSRLLITSTDVIHSFSLPTLGLKVDAVPGRINQLFCNPCRIGVFFGQCSEICGSNHSFMPIMMKFCSTEYFNKVNKFTMMEHLSEKIS